ncbi:hydantoinase B/oxoprolinase family protein [Aromatoleum toluclasticum]|uniref:hydantoinase B/oxoprolinase family protein n=1 Tax=Aromatoleum toluclasticum TaxID=92003 RepID=UPI00036823AA|nr:hydantoinase B/oxoprolinase family protein [Aromatoleum toluclasticum]
MTHEQCTAELSPAEKKLMQEFLEEHQLFFGPDPEIMQNHRLEPRTAREDVAIGKVSDPHLLNQVRGRVQSGMAESFRMIEQMGSAPGAKWGDLVTAVFTASGDLSEASPIGMTTFAAVCQYPIKFINKYWTNEPSVGVREGDGFIHNDSRYGGVHNTDQSMMMPLFYDGELICWVSSTIHEGENGAIEPGGMPARAESKYDEGLKMSPLRIVEGYEIKRDILTFLQNSVRDPKLQYEDVKVKLFAVMRTMERLRSAIDEFGVDALIAFLRKNLEDTEAEVRRRLSEMPDGVVRFPSWADSTLREPALIKHNCEFHKKGDKGTWVVKGSSPQLSNRAINGVIASLKSFLLTGLIQQIWPDLPRNQAVFSSFDFVADYPSLLNSDTDATLSMSISSAFHYLIKPGQLLNKLVYSVPLEAKTRVTPVLAAQYNQPATFIYGGLTQHMEVTGNFCADINGAGQGARENQDGLHSLSGCFSFMSDTGEQELLEEELPMVRLVAQTLAKDRMGFGKYRGGAGYEQMMSSKGSAMWGFMTGQTGSSFSSCPGLFGGYSSSAYPICRVKDINVFDWLKESGNPAKFPFDIVELMNKQPIEGGTYTADDAGITFELTTEGEIYMICQGGGGGYGDVLERDPELVMQDLREDLISDEVAENLFKVVYDKAIRRVDVDATKMARDTERRARIARGTPYKEFVKTWNKPTPPEHIPYYGSWGDDGVIYAGAGPTRITMTSETMKPVFLPDPREQKIAAMQARIAELEAKVK